MALTYSADDPEGALSDFRNSFNPRIAVTVDMIATGTDVKPIECLIFMRDVRSKNYFEQMKGRGTRTLSKIVWNSLVPLALDKDGNLNLSPSFIWGLALAVITCEVNRDERVNDTCWISMVTFKYLINDLWGKRDNVKTMIKSAYNVTIEEGAHQNA